MEERFVCISCWREFAVPGDEILRRGGKAVCPSCGYIQPLPAKLRVPATPITSSAVADDAGGKGGMARGIPTVRVSAVPERTEGDTEQTSRSDPGSDVREFEEDGPDIPDDAETIPGIMIGDPGSDDLDGATPSEGLRLEAGRLVVQEWHLKTPTGLTFKFTDPESLLGWKKKLGTYNSLTVSPDGVKWVDFARFVTHYEEGGNAVVAFLTSERELEAEKQVRAGGGASSSGGSRRKDARNDGGPDFVSHDSLPVDQVPNEDSSSAAAQFTFRVKEPQRSGWGKPVLFTMLALGLGAGVVMAVLYVMDIWSPF